MNGTGSSATAEKQRVSYACPSSLANWSCNRAAEFTENSSCSTTTVDYSIKLCRQHRLRKLST